MFYVKINSPPPRVPIQDSPVHSASGAWGYTEAATWPDTHYQSSDSFHDGYSHYPDSHQSSGWLSSTQQSFLSRLGWQQDYSHHTHNWHQDHSHHTHNWHSAYSSSAGGRYVTAGGRKIRHTRGLEFPQDTKACTITCISMVANISYAEARQAAINAVNASPSEEGVGFGDAHTVLETLGINARWYKNVPDWSGLPDLAIVCVYGRPNILHAVVFARLKNGAYIFDCNREGPVSCDGYVLYPDYTYIEIE